jgi:hypothetical protein
MRLALLPLIAVLCGCVATPDGKQELSPVGEAALQASVSIAVRHYIADSPKAATRAANIKKVVTQVRGFLNEESTLAALRGVVVEEIDRLGLSELDKDDAITLLDLVAVALEARLGDSALAGEGLIRVNHYLEMVLRAVPG